MRNPEFTIVSDPGLECAFRKLMLHCCEKPRARPVQSPPFDPARCSLSWESEQLDSRLHTLTLAASRKPSGSYQFCNTMQGRPKQLRQDLRLRALLLKQRQQLRERESQFRRRSRVIEWNAQVH